MLFFIDVVWGDILQLPVNAICSELNEAEKKRCHREAEFAWRHTIDGPYITRRSKTLSSHKTQMFLTGLMLIMIVCAYHVKVNDMLLYNLTPFQHKM